MTIKLPAEAGTPGRSRGRVSRCSVPPWLPPADPGGPVPEDLPAAVPAPAEDADTDRGLRGHPGQEIRRYHGPRHPVGAQQGEEEQGNQEAGS